MYTTHEHWLICPMHVLWKFDGRPCEQPECLKCMLKGRRPPQLWRYTGLLERAARHVDQFVSPSRFTARTHFDRGFSQPVAHLPYFVPRVDDDWRKPGPKPQDQPYFLFVGRLEMIKGLQTLIELWNTRRPDWDLLVAGTGTYDQQLRAMAAGNPRIKFFGALPQRELGALYYHALACIIPSITYETFGMINIESFARKTPVIARDLGALPEAIHDTGGGFVYRSDDELLAAMHQIAESPKLRSELGQKGYDGFLRWWTKEAHMEMYFDFLRRNAEKKFGCVPWEESGHRKVSRATA
jgi:glycosyltransferase involved in cell wall biosynthesis